MPGQLTDVNTASVHELAQLPGLGADRAQRVVGERQARRGFSSVAEFADAAGLAPHEHAQIRPHVVCSPSAQGPANSGYGRVLDF
jgi:DNA uptake protein ComE-like DNA-binding protein